MIIDGRALAQKIKAELKRELAEINLRPVLAVVLVGADPVSLKYIARKQKFGQDIGAEVRLFSYNETISEEDLLAEISRLAGEAGIHGLIVQLPLPTRLSADRILATIPPAKDVDALTTDSLTLSPVAVAVAEIFSAYDIKPAGRPALVIGAGRLVGRPVAAWLSAVGAKVKVADIKTKAEDLTELCRRAEIIVTGAGQPNLIKPEMIKPGAVIIDAGTSEVGGRLAGDADPACADMASLFTPVPGGVGPVVVAALFKNLLTLAKVTDSR
ncbi:MAG: bifunctional 5,10-methylenetetrahydrofolate dehydrogenase/5,10-methenyltetrahydrofolate cyclohydrolase [Candidatus Paceibacterota bacterium]